MCPIKAEQFKQLQAEIPKSRLMKEKLKIKVMHYYIKSIAKPHNMTETSAPNTVFHHTHSDVDCEIPMQF